MNKKYKLTVIGAGDRGFCYMRTLKQFFDESIEWDTVCDILPDRMDKAFEQFGFRAKEAEWEKAILGGSPDIVLIATPAYYHCDMAMFAMRNGCHVLSEKPMDLSLAKCFELKECREQTGKALALGMQYRNIPSFRAMQRAVEQGLFGENLMISFADIREVRPKAAMHDAVCGNGGPMVDMACHLFDLMRLYYNSDPVRVNCIWRKNAEGHPSLEAIENKAADACFMTVEYENGALGDIMMNWGMPSGTNGEFFCTVTGSKGLYITQSVPHPLPVVVQIEDFEEAEVFALPEDEDDLIRPERAVFKHFIEEIEGVGKSQVSEEHGIICLAASLAALRSGALGRPVTLEEIYKLKPTVFECMTAKE